MRKKAELFAIQKCIFRKNIFKIFLLPIVSLGAVVAGTSVAIVNLKILIEAKYWTIWIVLSVLASIISYIVLTLAYCRIYVENSLFDTKDVFYTYIYMFDWRILINILVTLISIFMALLPDFLVVIICDMNKRLKQNKKTMPL